MHRVSLCLLALFLSATALAANSASKVEFAYRDPTDRYTGGSLVQLQGGRDGGAPLSALCGQSGADCDCLFQRTATDRLPISLQAEGLSSSFNTLYCSMATIPNPEAFSFISLRNRKTHRATPRLPIRTVLKLEDVLGTKMSAQKVVGVYRYSCTHTFFEGEGVEPGSLSCVAGQHLGLITANYTFYTARSGDGTTFPGTGDVAFDTICGRNSFLKYQCSTGSPVLEYGFYKDSVAPYHVGIQMTRGPEAGKGDNLPLVNLYGYAALPDNAGHCPVGLMKARQWIAQPASITQGSLGNNPPSNFLNSNNSLNNTMVAASQPANFLVNRQPGAAPCSMTGDCSDATFGGISTVQSVAYMPVAPVICVIPPNLLSGIF